MGKTLKLTEAAYKAHQARVAGFGHPTTSRAVKKGQPATPSKAGRPSKRLVVAANSPEATGTPEELLLAQQLIVAGIPFLREFRFHSTRRWRFDFVLEGLKVAIEIDGGRWAPGGGRHGGDVDREKMAEAAIAGYRVIRVSPAQVRSGQAAQWAQRVL